MLENDPLQILLYEHKIILKMVETLKIFGKNLKNQKNSSKLILQIAQFFKIFADKVHHGKEENILFKKLKEKPLRSEERKILLELYEEHKKARILIVQLEEKNYSNLDDLLNEIVSLYEKHIEKENRRFFIPAFSYFSFDEKKQMREEFFEVNNSVLNEEYLQKAQDVEKTLKK